MDRDGRARRSAPGHDHGGATLSAPELERVARVEDVPDGGLLGVVKENGDRVCLIRRGEVIHAVSDICTHQEFSMSEGQLLPGDRCVIECAWHGAQFDCVTGAVRRSPAVDPLPVFEVKVENGDIYVGRQNP